LAGPDRPGRADAGFTLVETMVVLAVMAVLLAITVPIVSTLVQASGHVTNTYSNVDEQLVLSTNLQRLLRAAVAPAPSYYTGDKPVDPPVTPFVPGKVGPTSVTFYSNTGTPNGPVEVRAWCTPTPTSPTRCKAPTSTFTVTVTSPKAGTCPFLTGTLSNHCTWPATAAKTLLSIPHVRNGGDTTPLPPFAYAYGAAPSPGSPLTTTSVCSVPGYPAGCTPTSSDSTTFSTSKCLPSTTPAHPFAKCPVGEIDEISYDLQINASTSALYGGLQAQDATGIFVLSSTSMLYDAAVG
jgi:prepilin-type N-terminal cleavage/methylation domain-containing protein